ncbi:MAG: DUF3800 domain-containing protein [Chitinivibrionales bacterium]|nr:DUF3800 domain-containing protein [Chitinivibrionales bacterium]
MSFHLFLDESGHDHKMCPYEVRGGIALHVSKLWSFVQNMQALEIRCFGEALHKFGLEIKGERLLKKKRFRNAAQLPELDESSRRRLALSFLNKGAAGIGQTKSEFTAYSQSCLCMAQGVFELLSEHEAVIFAAAIPLEVKKPSVGVPEDFLRKDQVFLFERFFHFLEKQNEHGLIVMDETDKSSDREFVARMHNYFTRTQTGRFRASLIVPSPVFVESDMAYPVQAADICIYCINWGFRLSNAGMLADCRPEIRDRFMPWLQKMQFHGERRDGDRVWPLHGILCVPDPYESRGV